MRSREDFDPSVALTSSDIAVDRHQSPTLVRVRLKQSKTDPFRHGVDVYLGRTDADLCPVAALLAYMAVRPHLTGPLFIFKDGSFLTRDRLVAAVREALQEAGIDSAQYTGHSFRIGDSSASRAPGLSCQNVGKVGVHGISKVHSDTETNSGSVILSPSDNAGPVSCTRLDSPFC